MEEIIAKHKSKESSTSARLAGNNLLKKSCRHSNKDHGEILSLYSKSIAYAPNDSEELAFGYGNRSFLLTHLKMYQLSIIDIDRAMKITKSNVLKAKLICRKIASLKSMNEPIPEPVVDEAEKLIKINDNDMDVKVKLRDLFEKAIHQEIDPKSQNVIRNNEFPTIDPNLENPDVSASIRLEYDKKFGRHYKAIKNILPGETLIIEQGYAVILERKQFYINCSYCTNIAWTGVPCNNCPCVIYCSIQCKEAAWKTYHILECPILMLVFEEVSNCKYIYLTLRILARGLREDPNGNFDYLLKEFLSAKNEKDGRTRGFKNNKFCSDSVRSIFSLTTHFELSRKAPVSPSLQKFLNILNSRFEKLYFSSELHPLLRNFDIHSFRDFIMNIYCLTIINTQKCSSRCYADNPGLDIGAFIGACTSLLNHSCVSNTTAFFKDGRILLFAIRPIEQNEQIFHSYGPGYNSPTIERRQCLFDKYYFSCDCIACEKNWTLPRSQIYSNAAYENFDPLLLLEMGGILINADKNPESLNKTDVKKIMNELQSHYTKIFKSNTLLDALSILSLNICDLPMIYEVYYAHHTYISGD